MKHPLNSFLFCLWVKAHARPLRLSELRPLWHEVHRYLVSVNS